MGHKDYQSLPPQEKDSLKIIKATPAVKQVEYYDFNAPDADLNLDAPKKNTDFGLPNKKTSDFKGGLPNNKTKPDSLKEKQLKPKEKKEKKEEAPKKSEKSAKELKQEKPELKSAYKPDSQKPEPLKKAGASAIEIKAKELEPAKPKVEIDYSKYNFYDKNVKHKISYKYLDGLGIDTHVYSVSLFTNHELKVKSGNVVLKNRSNYDWMLWILIFSLLSFASLKVLRFKKLKAYFSAFFSERVPNQLLREEKPFADLVSFQLFVGSILTISLFIYHVFIFYDWNLVFQAEVSITLYLSILALIVIVFFSKVFVFKAMGHIFLLKELAVEYIFTYLLFFNILGLLIAPVIVLLQYFHYFGPQLIIISGLILVGIIYLYGIYRALIMGLGQSTVSKFYLFIYLCTLEFLPILILVKIFSRLAM